MAASLLADKTFSRDMNLLGTPQTVTAEARDASGRVSTDSRTVDLPLAVNYTYDLNGNLLSDGRRHFSYDDENQLTH